MVLAKRGGMRKRGGLRKKRMPIRRRGFRPAKNVAEWASLSVTQWIGQVTTANQMYNIRNIALSQFPRAVQVAQAYQHYRIKKVMLEFKPAYDTFAPLALPAGQNLQVPYLVYMIDKSGSIPTNVSSDDLYQMGAKPVRFDDKTIKVAWRPSVLTETFGQANAQSQYKISPWLSTNANALNPGVFLPSDIDHLGCFFKVDRAGVLPVGYEEYTYEVKITVEFQFKKPLVKATSPNESVSITVGALHTDVSGNLVAQV